MATAALLRPAQRATSYAVASAVIRSDEAISHARAAWLNA